MELVLTLFRNLLAIPNENMRDLTSENEYMSHLHEDLIILFDKENVYGIVMLLAQDIQSKESREWNLLIMEMLELTIQCTNPEVLIDLLLEKEDEHKFAVENQALENTHATQKKPHKKTGLSTLLSKESMNRQRRQGHSRHSNFGGILTVQGSSGNTRIVTNLSKPSHEQIPQAKRKVKKNSRRRKGVAMNDLSDVFGSSKPSVTNLDEYVNTTFAFFG